jgi:hypothetical protein
MAVVWHVTMSLDGFVAGPDDAMDWVFDDFSEAFNETAREVIETTGAILGLGEPGVCSVDRFSRAHPADHEALPRPATGRRSPV